MQGSRRTIKNKIYSADEASELLGIKKTNLYNLIREGKIQALQITEGGRYRIRPEELKRYMRLQKSN